eukprot:CAMPEP_0204619906 /NCGR_PEP_ID=MMETSP0717-20131115/6113_1 /ASSEMBLY_ACC=CAM_ASM_000666 /TAXON_ID=230516 /ORGANISM="Chaetoceros curvisetus" /LENGTH=203 /DNA_ID=CAMNT_0051633983 /DNA_START=62 /DNA_END=674 /DNA_ORIENTATION=+
MSEQQNIIPDETSNSAIRGSGGVATNIEISNASTNIATMTITETAAASGTATSTDQEEVMPLTLRERPTVTWKFVNHDINFGGEFSHHEHTVDVKIPSSRSFQCLLKYVGGINNDRDEGVLDNEGLGRKSSKRCCIFHKQRSFGESSTDSSDDDHDDDSVDSGSSSSSGGGFPSDGKKPKPKRRPIARPKKDKKVPNYQRFHA